MLYAARSGYPLKFHVYKVRHVTARSVNMAEPHVPFQIDLPTELIELLASGRDVREIESEALIVEV